MDIKTYVEKLQALKADLPKKVDEILLQNQKHIVGLLKARLYNEGTDGLGNIIGEYAKSTLVIKRKNNQKTSFITLRDTGRFYEGMFLESKNGRYIIDSKDRKTALLIEIYGESILDLTVEQQEYIIMKIIEPALQSILDNLGTVEITL